MAKRFELSQSDRDKLAAILRNRTRRRLILPPRRSTPRQRSAGIHFRNDEAETVPAYAVMQVSTADLDRNRPFVTVVQPTSSGTIYLINGPRDVAAGDYGVGYREGRCLYLDGSGLGDYWSPVAGEWYLAKDGWDFRLVDLLDDDTGLFWLNAEPKIVRGKTDSSVIKGGTVAVSIYIGTTDTGRNITATDLYADLDSGKWVHCALVNGEWDLIAGEC